MLGIFSGHLVNSHNHSERGALLEHTHPLLLAAAKTEVTWVKWLAEGHTSIPSKLKFEHWAAWPHS